MSARLIATFAIACLAVMIPAMVAAARHHRLRRMAGSEHGRTALPGPADHDLRRAIAHYRGLYRELTGGSGGTGTVV
jgi:hypothetical protein